MCAIRQTSASRSRWRPTGRLAIGLLTGTLLVGCASNGGNSITDPADPLEPFNRKMHAFNDGLDRFFLKPVAKGYTTVTPDRLESGIHNFYLNLRYPTVIVNQFLQGKPRAGARDIGRLLTNTVLGLGGLFDVASRLGLERNQEDFGQTFAVWGAGRGPYLVLPFLGPATLRGGAGDAVGIFTSPIHYVEDDGLRWGLRGLSIVDGRAQRLDTEELVRGDEYLFIRDAYLQRRAHLIRDGEVQEDPFLDEDIE